MIKQKDRIFIGCEGNDERSYCQYVSYIADDLNLNLHIDPVLPKPGGGDPLGIVEKCIQEMLKREKNHGKYIHKAILLDADTLGLNTVRDQKIQQIAQNRNIKIIFNKPKIEALLLHHFPNCERLKPNANNVEQLLKRQWTGYQHGQVNSKELYHLLGEDGLRRACIVETELKGFLNILGFNI